MSPHEITEEDVEDVMFGDYNFMCNNCGHDEYNELLAMAVVTKNLNDRVKELEEKIEKLYSIIEDNNLNTLS
jgi:phosphate uptake regulator